MTKIAHMNDLGLAKHTDFAIDVGGTFTDLVVRDNVSGNVRRTKVSTTPSDPSEGIRAVIKKAGINLPSVRRFFHGTTFGLNTILENKGARVGLITTRGFRDSLELGRIHWPMYQLHWDQPAPLIPRYLRHEVDERMRADGVVLRPLDEDGVRRAVEDLLANDVEAIAVCFLHSYAWAQHELRVGEILDREYPDLDYTLSHQVTQEYYEYERTATTVVDAAVKPRMVRYLSRLESALEDEGFDGTFFVTRCDGGVMSGSEAKRHNVQTLMSGPASGVMGAVALGRSMGESNLITFDMGGTSVDSALIVDGSPTFGSVADVSGIPLLTPVIDIATIGAGGGSIAWIDQGGVLNVGPQSASAQPGPICVSRGGTEPTFTDAALVSGLLDAENFLGGEIALDIEAARAGIKRVIADPLGLSVEEAASGIIALTEAKCAAMLDDIGLGKGYDPRTFALVAYGGGGSLVASAVASRMQIGKVIIPPAPGTFSAWGMLTLDIVHDFSRTLIARLDALQGSEVVDAFAELHARAVDRLDAERVELDRRQTYMYLDMRYDAQEHSITVPIGAKQLEMQDFDGLRALFNERHEATYGYAMEEEVELVGLRVRAVGSLDKPRVTSSVVGAGSDGQAFIGRRTAWHRESGGQLEWSIFNRDLLETGDEVKGPAIVEEAAATTLVAPGQRLTVDTYGNMILEKI